MKPTHTVTNHGTALIIWFLIIITRNFQILLQRTLETITIIVSATQLLCTGVIHVGVSEFVPPRTGRV